MEALAPGEKRDWVHHKDPTNRDRILQLLSIQLRTLGAQCCISKIEVPCACCDRKVSMTNAFKCFYCHLWFCKGCAREHFEGDHP